MKTLSPDEEYVAVCGISSCFVLFAFAHASNQNYTMYATARLQKLHQIPYHQKIKCFNLIFAVENLKLKRFCKFKEYQLGGWVRPSVALTWHHMTGITLV